jgi:hypothetical protein
LASLTLLAGRNTVVLRSAGAPVQVKALTLSAR